MLRYLLFPGIGILLLDPNYLKQVKPPQHTNEIQTKQGAQTLGTIKEAWSSNVTSWLANLLHPGLPQAVVNKWTYNGINGQADWARIYPECQGRQQSPINIQHHHVRHASMPPLHFKNYHTVPNQIELKNQLHSIKLEYDMPHHVRPSVTGGGLQGEYIFAQLHFHWGPNNKVGSEHTINGYRYPFEVHLVHYNSKYKDLGEAIKHPDGLAVIGVLGKIGKTSHPALWNVAYYLKYVEEDDSETEIPKVYSFPLDVFLPAHRHKFYRYHGSLTTPPCSESVVWTLFDELTPITEAQLNLFRKVEIENYRRIQYENGRNVYST